MASERCCVQCGRSVFDAQCWFDRVNPIGELPAVWKCRPHCGASMSQDDALRGALGAAPASPECKRECFISHETGRCVDCGAEGPLPASPETDTGEPQ